MLYLAKIGNLGVKKLATKQNRIMITVSDENLRRLEAVNKKFGVSKSAQIQSLVAKYLEKEYGIVEKGESNEDK